MNDFAITNEDTAIVVELLANDNQPNNLLDPATVTFVNAPQGATLAGDGKSLVVPNEGTYTLAAGGPTQFTNPTDGITGYRFDGVDDGVLFGGGALVEGTGPLTISMQVRTTTAGKMTLLAQGNSETASGYHLGITADGKVTFTLGNGNTQQFSLSSTSAINDGEWHQIAVQRDGRTGIVWVDGEVQAAVNGSEAIALSLNTTTTLGYSQGNDATRFQGDLGPVRVSSKSLSEADIFGYAAPDEAEVGAHRRELTQDADSILGMGLQGWRVARIGVTGRNAFGLYVNGSIDEEGNPQGDRGVGAAATEWGLGRLVLHTQYQSLQWNQRQGQQQTGQFYANTVKWLAKTDDKDIKVVTTQSNTADWFKNNGYTNVVNNRAWWNELGDADILVGDVENAEHVQNVREFVRAGGGLYTARSAFNDHEHTKQVLEGSGLQLTDDNSWISSYGAIATKYSHAVNALDLLEPNAITDIAAQREAGKNLAESFETLPAGDPLRTQITKAVLGYTADIIPTRDNPFSGTALDLALLKVEASIIQATPASAVEKHRTAEIAYGVIPDNAPRIDKTINIDLSEALIHTKKHSTGIYVAPGELVKVTVPDHLVGQGAYFKINNHTDDILQYKSQPLERFPRGISREFKIESADMEIANAFGGFVYLVVPGEKSLGVMELAFENAIAAPHFVLGETTDAEWNASIKNNPAPYAEIVTNNLTITLPSEHVRDLNNPTELAMLWEQVELAQDYLRGIENSAIRGEGMNIDAQISIGAAHSGYPTQAPQDSWASSITDYESLLNHGNWGWFHELGHQHQRSYTGTDGDGEHTVNIFTMATMDALGAIPASSWKAMWNPDQRIARFESEPNGFRSMDVGQRLVLNAQLSRSFGWEAYRNIYLTYENDPSNRPKNEQEERDQWVIHWSQEVGRDLTPFFDAWQYGHSQAAIDTVASLNLPEWSMIEILPTENAFVGTPNADLTFDLSKTAWGAAANGELTFTEPAVVDNGTLTNLGNGQFTFTPDADYIGNQLVDFQVTNAEGGSATISVDIQTVTQITSDQAVDTLLFSNYPNSDYSATKRLKVGDSFRTAQSLLRFDDLAGTVAAGQVPAVAEILTATLEYALDDDGSTVDFHRMLSGWEDTDTWNSLGSGIQLEDAEAATRKDFSVNHRDNRTHTADVTETVRGWLANPSTNHGWAIMPTGSDSMEIASAESTRPPKLHITYAPPGAFDPVTNQAPVTTGQAISTDEDKIIAIDVLARTIDPDGPDNNINTVDLLATVVTQASNGRVHRLPDGKLAYIPNKNFNGTDSFTYSISDGTDSSNIATVNLTVNDINDAPIALLDKVTTDFNQPIEFDPLANDTEVDGNLNRDSAVFVQTAWTSADGKNTTIPNQGTFTFNKGRLTFVPVSGFSGSTHPLKYQVADDDGATTTAFIDIVVNPEMESGPATRAPVDYIFSPETAVLATFTPDANVNGPLSPVTYQADGKNNTLNLTVTPVNDLPIAREESVSTEFESAIAINTLLNDTLGDGTNTLSITSENAPQNGSAAVQPDNNILYTPNLGFSGSDNFTYTLTDENGDLSTDTITVQVKAEPQPVETTVPTDNNEPTDISEPQPPANISPINPSDRAPTASPLEKVSQFISSATRNAIALTRWLTTDILQLQAEEVGVTDISEIVIFKTGALNLSRQEVGRFSLLKGGQLSTEYAPMMSLRQGEIDEGDLLEFSLIERGVSRTATIAVDNNRTFLDFGNGTQFSIAFNNTQAATNLLLNDAATIDLSSMDTTVSLKFSVYREAALDSTVGFYTTDFADGGIITDTLLGNILRPGDTGYEDAALNRRLDIELTGTNGKLTAFSTEIEGGSFLSTFLTVGGESDIFFSHLGANTNSNQHIKMLGDNTFGFEDMKGLGDRDYNDLVVQFAQVE